MEVHKMREVYKPNMTEVGLYFYQLEKLIEVSKYVCTYVHVAMVPEMYCVHMYVNVFISVS